MQNRMIFGRYYDTGSWVHSLDPRAKVAAMLMYMVAIFMVSTFIEAAAVFLFAIVIMQSTRIPLSQFLRSLKPLIFIMVFIFAFHLLFDASGTRMMAVGPFKFYSGGLERGILAVVRMILFVGFTAILTFTTPPAKLTRGLEDFFRPLKILRISPARITLMIEIALRFIPTVFEEAEKILKAQSSRGMDLKDQPLAKKAKLLISLLVPVTVSAVRRAMELVDSMESRGYRLGAPRSKFHALDWARRDTVFILVFVVLLGAMLALNMSVYG
ncbi:energy-coupling factor transporter transmembrane component T family protein [Gorillibacterium massiliense]|uniref:energy-coupling factor transporter transmembrane component T family protein n=1 Tax=Gorillibacterium massiliense TaxID=1280390 RepID=UPI0004B7E193|nr:energy-coupling factor transporter transmembrane component T [Gorillibacterium massiliense]